MIIGSVASGGSGGGPVGPPLPDFQIQNSLRLRETSYLQITNPAAPTSGKKFTFSVWVKNIYKVDDYCTIYMHNPYNLGTPSARYGFGIFLYNGELYVNSITVGTTTLQKQLGYQLKDNASWYHIVVAVDTDNAVAADRCIIYINGVKQTNFVAGSLVNPAQGTVLSAPSGNNVTSYIGAASFTNPNSIARYMKGYLADFILVDGQTLLPTVFGEVNAATNTWVPIDPSIASVGNTGFRLKFNNTTSAANLCLSSIGTNHFGPVNVATTLGPECDAMIDAPSGALTNNCGNYCVLDGNILPVGNSPTSGVATLTEGNLKVYGAQATSPDTGLYSAIGTQAVNGSKVYFEVVARDISLTPVDSFVGFCKITNISDGVNNIGVAGSQSSFGISPLINNTWRAHTNNVYSGIASISNLNNNDVIGIAFDAASGKLWVSKNGSFAGTQNPAAGTGEVINSLPIDTWIPVVTSVNQNVNGSVSLTANFGQRPFQYTPPTGFSRIYTNTLSSSITNSHDYFSTYLYTGNGTSVLVGTESTSPDFVWIKSRSTGANHTLFDRLRGVGKILQSNTISTETTDLNSLTEFSSAGFAVGSATTTNANGSNYVAWGWKANDTGTTNTLGSITSTVSVNNTAGFSIVSYTGTGSDATIGHGLSAIPKLVIVKHRTTTSNWPVYHEIVGPAQYLYLNTADPEAFGSQWGNLVPTNNLLYIGGTGLGVNDSGITTIAYCFAEVPGFSRISWYNGNNNIIGPFIYTGFKPAVVIIKRKNGGTGDWKIIDLKRTSSFTEQIDLNSDIVPTPTSRDIVLLSNGFKITSTDSDFNASSSSYIFAAFAESPFKYSPGA